jgi:hypothetical protein
MKTKQEDLTGRAFGKLTAVKVSEVGARGSCKWLCKCDCGIEVVVPYKSLVSGNNKSCGCLKTEVVTARNKALAKDLTNKTFGRWTVLSLCEHRNYDGGLIWLCKCECGAMHNVSSARLLRGRSIQCTECSKKQGLKKYCKHGHNTEIWGRDKYGYCKGCVRERHLQRTYGISLEEFKELYDHQQGKCAICKIPLIDYLDAESLGKRAEVDHEHNKNKPIKNTVRGLLCGGKWSGCNNMLGKVDNVEWLKNAIQYLVNPPAAEVLDFGSPEGPIKEPKKDKR